MVLVVKNPPANAGRCKRCGFHPWVEKMHWSRAWQPTPVFLPRESHGQRSLAGYGPQGCKESDTTEMTQRVSGAAGVRPNRDKVSGQERNLQRSSSSRGCPRGPICPLRSRWLEKGICKAALPLEVVPGTRSWDEKGICKAALPLEVVPGTRSREEKRICKAALPLEAVPGARFVPFFLRSYCCWAFY